MAGKARVWTVDIFRNYWIKEVSGCWRWIGRTYPNTYGRIGYKGSEICSHRLSWIVHNGQIPSGLWVLHKCDNPGCVNPDHLFLGTHRDNEDDKMAKGRQMHAEDHYAAKLNWQLVRFIRTSSDSGSSLAGRMGVSTSTISMIRSGRIWKEIN